MLQNPFKMLAAVCVGALGAEFYVKDSVAMQRRQLRKRLLSGLPAHALYALPHATISPAGLNMEKLETLYPIILAGPPRIGRSTALRLAAQHFAAPLAPSQAADGSGPVRPHQTAGSIGALLARVAGGGAPPPRPVLLMRFSRICGWADNAPQSEPEPAWKAAWRVRELERAAEDTLEQMGVSARPSLLTQLFPALSAMLRGVREAPPAEQSQQRLKIALHLLYSEARRISRERLAAGVPAHEAPPVVLIDNADAFIASRKLADAGGGAVTRQLFLQLQLAAPWFQRSLAPENLRPAAAGAASPDPGVLTVLTGSHMLHSRWDALHMPRGWLSDVTDWHWRFYQLGDPSPDAAVAALQAAGHSKNVAESIVAALGTRPDSLAPLLSPRVAADSERTQVALRGELQQQSYRRSWLLNATGWLTGVGAAGRAALTRAAAEDGATPAGSRSHGPWLRDEATLQLIEREHLYQDLEGTVRFASPARKAAWLSVEQGDSQSAPPANAAT